MTKTRAAASRPPMLTDRAHQLRAIANATSERDEERRFDEVDRDQRG
jgi:hypothetical protein